MFSLASGSTGTIFVVGGMPGLHRESKTASDLLIYASPTATSFCCTGWSGVKSFPFLRNGTNVYECGDKNKFLTSPAVQ